MIYVLLISFNKQCIELISLEQGTGGYRYEQLIVFRAWNHRTDVSIVLSDISKERKPKRVVRTANGRDDNCVSSLEITLCFRRFKKQRDFSIRMAIG